MKITFLGILHHNMQTFVFHERIIVLDDMRMMLQPFKELYFPQRLSLIRSLEVAASPFGAKVDLLHDVYLVVAGRTHLEHCPMGSFPKLLEYLEVTFLAPDALCMLVTSWIDEAIVV
jgi:hypothetical protein